MFRLRGSVETSKCDPGAAGAGKVRFGRYSLIERARLRGSAETWQCEGSRRSRKDPIWTICSHRNVPFERVRRNLAINPGPGRPGIDQNKIFSQRSATKTRFSETLRLRTTLEGQNMILGVSFPAVWRRDPVRETLRPHACASNLEVENGGVFNGGRGSSITDM